MKYKIKNCFSSEVQFIAEIDCDENTSEALKKGLAVKWALKNKADLAGANLEDADLTGADLEGVNLIRANLVGADLIDANLKRADLIGANLTNADLAGADLEDANLDFSSWFAKQDQKWQENYLGKDRFELYKSGKVTIKKFTDDLGRPLTLKELDFD